MTQFLHKKHHDHKNVSIADIVQKYQVSAAPKASDATARLETAAGFRPRENKAMAASKSKKASKVVKIGSVTIITRGLDAEGNLRGDHCPKGSEFEGLLDLGLAVLKTAEAEDLSFKKTWDHPRIDKWFRQLFPAVFEFLDSRYPDDVQPAYHWVVLNKDRLKLYVMKRTGVDGALLDDVKGSNTKPAKDHAILPATKHKIPSAVYKSGFEDAIARMLRDGDPASESEEELPKTKQRSQRGKKKVESISASESGESSQSESAESSEVDELDDEGGLGKAASDNESFPAPIELFLAKNGSESESEEIPRTEALSYPQPAKRRSSQSLDRGAGKRVRRNSDVISISDGEPTSADNSPRLRAAASSFNLLATPAPVSTASTGPINSSPMLASSSALTGSRLGGYTPFSATVRTYVPPPPAREGLHVPKSKKNIWD
ncbi:hypothetical protein C8R45DRAFT_1137952 [Mycena sanguinolenta]|nr:hypothetical protein C8R45DRAFT_1137952 [Mycena sanguinolenta]